MEEERKQKAKKFAEECKCGAEGVRKLWKYTDSRRNAKIQPSSVKWQGNRITGPEVAECVQEYAVEPRGKWTESDGDQDEIPVEVLEDEISFKDWKQRSRI